MPSLPESDFRLRSEDSLLSFLDKSPFEYYENLRELSNIYWDDGLGGWILLSETACRLVESREELFRIMYADATPMTKEVKGGDTISTLVGERHYRARRFHMKLLSPKVVLDIRDNHIRPVIHWLIDRFAEAGKAELTTDLAYQIPTRMTLSMFGLDWHDSALVSEIHESHNAIVDWIGRGNPDDAFGKRALTASHKLNAMLMPLIEARRDGEGTDLVSQIWRGAPEFYDDLDTDTVLSICRELLFAGADTTMQALANAMYLLLTNTAAREAIRQGDDKALNTFTEEALRLYPSAQWRYRRANQDIELESVQVRRDDLVVSVKAAANRDPAKYSSPSEIDLNRSRPTDHLTFNVGPRTCAGAAIARAEIREMISIALERLPDLRLDPSAVKPKLRGVYMQGHLPLHVLVD